VRFEDETGALISPSLPKGIKAPVARYREQPGAQRRASIAKSVDALDGLKEDLSGDVFGELAVADL